METVNVFGFEVKFEGHPRGRDAYTEDFAPRSKVLWENDEEEIQIHGTRDDLGDAWQIKRIDEGQIIVCLWRNLAIGKDYSFYYSGTVDGASLLNSIIKEGKQ